ncbi:unnamed protein product [Meganyctiphanes norvegica]|uniref:MRH domain-containing protein n=1 Tax=Meganyctiphanes norvegica TaxID=48144 RepID=A0AAV2QYY9_MEGNR
MRATSPACTIHHHLVMAVLLLLLLPALCTALRGCDESDFHYEFTECDETGGRWRVSIPNAGSCTGGSLSSPTRIHDCSVSCQPGFYFNVSSISCTACPSGTYSLGGGVHFDSWTDLPKGFSKYTEVFRSAFSVGRRRPDLDCSSYGWQARGDVLASKGGPCAAVLVYTVKLVKPGSLFYTYQYNDENLIFEFQAQNDQCQSIDDADDYKWPPLTREGQWKRVEVALTTGLNVLHWKTIGIENHGSSRPVMIKSIEISGVAYTSECTECPAGTYSADGAKICTECKEGTYSPRGSVQCKPCDPKLEYAPKGSPNCIQRPSCTTQDYYEIDSACDKNNQTRAIYKWVDPRVCNEASQGSVSLPPSGEVKTCPPCNPGMHYTSGPVTSGCVFCPRDQHSDGISPCGACPPSTAPNYGYQYTWWSGMPPRMAATCMSADDTGCSSAEGWQLGGDHIHSGRGHADDAYLVLSLKVGGFRGREGFVSGRPMEVGKISFTFELSCTSDCEFVFMDASNKKGVNILQSWTGQQPRQYYSFIITRNDSYTFSWAFQKVSWEKSYLKPGSSRKYESDMAKIFNINVTNTIDGGASSCLPCPQSPSATSCIPCPAGQYIEENTTECTACPANTVVTDPLPYGPKSCLSCGPGLTAPDHLSCMAQCKMDIEGHNFDLTNISSARAVVGSTLFTSSGTKYFHMFNISLCGDTRVTCLNNVSYNLDGESTTVVGHVCRSTIVPAVEGLPGRVGAVATQSVSLGDHLLGVTTNSSLMGIDVIEEFVKPDSKDIHFFYTSPSFTSACPDGRSTTLTLRCDVEESGQGQVTLPHQCPDGTCDGCNFHFLWKTPLACPVCTNEDLIVVRGECQDGHQAVHYITPNNCRTPDKSPEEKSIPCTTELPFIIEVAVSTTASLAFLLCLFLYCMWKKNQRLEYKYMKLVANSSSKDGVMELPPAESCALDDGEDEEVQFSNTPSRGLLNKFKNNKVSDFEHRGLLMETMKINSKNTFT